MAINTTPYYAWYKRMPDYSDMRVFGSHVYVVNTDITWQKLDTRTFLGFYFKYTSTMHAVVYYNPTTKAVGRSSHVYFDEVNVGLKSSHKPKFGQGCVCVHCSYIGRSFGGSLVCMILRKGIKHACSTCWIWFGTLSGFILA